MRKRRCFVISPIGDEDSDVRKHANRVFERLIKPAINECAAFGYRSDHLREPGGITERMFKAILQDDFCIALLTGYNPNVFFELAVARCFGKPAILLMEKGRALPFDIQDLRCIYYDPKIRSFRRYRAELVDQIHSLKCQRWADEPLLTRYLPGVEKQHKIRYTGDLIDDQRVEYLLRGIKETYWRYFADRDKPIVKVRLNIMTPSKSTRVKEPRLRIVSADYINDYDDDELGDKWFEDQGKCGEAWKTGQQKVFDADHNTGESQFKNMGTKSDATQRIRSVVSTPVKWRNQRVALLNMDSFQGGRETLVRNNQVRTIFRSGARELAPLLVDIWAGLISKRALN